MRQITAFLHKLSSTTKHSLSPSEKDVPNGLFRIGSRKQTPRHGRSSVHSESFFPCVFMASSRASSETSWPSAGTGTTTIEDQNFTKEYKITTV